MRLKNGLEIRQLTLNAYLLENVDGICNDFKKVITLNSSAAFLWQALCGCDFSVSDVASLLIDKYGIDEETARDDAESIIKTWEKASLIEV